MKPRVRIEVSAGGVVYRVFPSTLKGGVVSLRKAKCIL